MGQLDLFTGELSTIVHQTSNMRYFLSRFDFEYFLERVSVVDLAKHYLGENVFRGPISENYKSLCVFHQEKTASLYFYPKTNTFVCYGCGARGGPFTFLAEMEKVSLKGVFDLFHFEKRNSLVLEQRVVREYYSAFTQAVEREGYFI